MSRPPLAPIVVPWRQRLDDWCRDLLPFAAWLAAAGGAVALMARRGENAPLAGLVHAPAYEVSSTGGVLRELLVELHQPVAAGQAVAVLDGAALEARAATASAQVEQILAELRAAEASLTAGAAEIERDFRAELRRFLVDETQFALESQQLRSAIAADRAEAERLGLRAQRAEALAAEAVGSQAELDDARLAHRRVLERAAENEGLLQELIAAREQAAARRAGFAALAPLAAALEPQLAVIRAQAEVQRRLLQELEVERAALVLRAGTSGIVQQVLARAGQAITAGEPIAILQGASDGVMAYLREDGRLALDPGQQVEWWPQTAPDRRRQGKIGTVAPVVEELPVRLWRNPAVAEFGRAVWIPDPALAGQAAGSRIQLRPLP